MPRTPLLVALVALAVLSGCASLVGDDAAGGADRTTIAEPSVGTATPATGASGSSADPATATPTATTPTATSTPRPPDNPWRAESVTIALQPNGHTETDYDAALRSTVDYWNRNTQFANYTVDLVYPNATGSADIVVEIRADVGTCGYEETERFLGCAPLLTTSTRAERPETVQIEAGYNQRGTRSIMIHELGHVLGVRHGEEPTEYMEANERIFEVEQPDASERAFPWPNATFTVHVDASGLPAGDRQTAREQVGHAVDYYSRIATEDADVPSNLSVRVVDDPADANVRVSFPSSLPCEVDSGSCVRRSGFDPDGDGAIEYYTETEITIRGVPPETIGWHTGYMFGLSLGIDQSNLPAPLRATDPATRRSEWWTHDP